MKRVRHQAGFSIVEIVIVIVVVALVGVLGVIGYSRWQESMTKTDTTSQSANTDDSITAPNVDSTEDLDAAIESLDETDVTTEDNADTNQLDSQASAF